MELATNTISKGLLLDVNPMVQSNDSLSDCLNGTIVTMNGNEVILQNDMGNRRIDNAFLPAGYQPVGMKEYGGIIYVAAYNPITNKSQIGSFPSPQKKFNNFESSAKLEFNNFFEGNNIFEESFNSISKTLQFIKSDNILIPLIEDVNMCPGDKFIVYSNELNSNEVSNLNNVNNGKIISPKNKQYTLFLGVLNSLNEFVDITPSLNRWHYKDGESGVILFPENTSDEYKFNSGYFIAENFGNYKLEETIDDAKFIKNRQASPINTYSSKLIGPLYLKAKLNHVENFDYTIHGYIDKTSSQVVLTIEGTLTYNCPDGVSNLDSSNDIYQTYEEGTPYNIKGFDIFTSQDVPGRPETTSFKETTYDKKYNNYRLKVVKEIKLNYYENDESKRILNYVISVPAILNNSASTYYLRGLTTEGNIDLSLLNSGTINLTSWRFFNNGDLTTTITYGFELYPKPGHEFRDLILNINGINYSQTLNVSNLGTVVIPWNEFGLEERQIYEVHLICSDYNTLTESSSQINFDNLWILTTSLFNSCYTAGGDYIENYCQRKNLEEESIFDRKTTIEIEFDNNVSNNSTETIDTEGSIFGDTDDIRYIETVNTHINLDFTLNNIKIKNEELYPVSLGTLSITPTLLNNNIDEIELEKEYLGENKNYYVQLNSVSNGSNSSRLSALLKVRYALKATGETKDEIENLFVPMSEAIDKIIQHNEDLAQTCFNSDLNAALLYPYPYFGIGLDYDKLSVFGGSEYYKLITFIKSTSKNGMLTITDPESEVNPLSSCHPINESNRKSAYYCIYINKDSTITPYKEYIIKNESLLTDGKDSYDRLSRVDEKGGFTSVPISFDTLIAPMFNNEYSLLDETLNCSWIFTKGDEQYVSNYLNGDTKVSDSKNSTIVWWKCNNDIWAASKYLIPKEAINKNDHNYKTLVEYIFGSDFYFCYYNKYKGNNTLYSPIPGSVYCSLFKEDKSTLKFTVSLNILTNNGGLILDNNFNFFKLKTENKLCEYSINIGNNSAFYDNANTINNGIEPNCVDIKGRSKTVDGLNLRIGSIYVEENGRLKEIRNPFSIGTNDYLDYNVGNNLCRQIVCNNPEYGPIKIKNDYNELTLSLGSGSSRLDLFFLEVPLIPRFDITRSLINPISSSTNNSNSTNSNNSENNSSSNNSQNSSSNNYILLHRNVTYDYINRNLSMLVLYDLQLSNPSDLANASLVLLSEDPLYTTNKEIELRDYTDDTVIFKTHFVVEDPQNYTNFMPNVLYAIKANPGLLLNTIHPSREYVWFIPSGVFGDYSFVHESSLECHANNHLLYTVSLY